MARRRLDVKMAAQELGISTDAVHKRVRRGSLEADKDAAGRVFVYLGNDLDDDYTPDRRRDAHIASLEDQVEFLRRELERKDTTIMTMAQRIPELEPASEPRESSKRATEDDGRGEEGCSGARINGRPPGWSYRLLSGKSKGKVEREDEWLLRLPVPVVLVILWIAGAALMGLCVLVLYSYG